MNILIVNPTNRPIPVSVVGGATGGTPGGATTQVQFNDAGAFGGDADLTWNKATNTLANTGKYLAGGGSALIPGYSFGMDISTGLFFATASGQYVAVTVAGSGVAVFRGWPGIVIPSNGFYYFSATLDPAAIPDTGIYRNAAGVVEINTGVAGTFGDLKAKNVAVQTGGKATGAGTVPAGGTTGQILKKLSNADYDVGWVT
jgi:hypothetical protein